MWDVRVCAACLATDVRMYSMSSYSLLQPYQLLTGTQLQSGDGMPRKLCWECAAFVNKFNLFRHKCERAHLLLQDLYNQHDEISEEDVKHVDRNAHGMSSNLSMKILSGVIRSKAKKQKNKCVEKHKSNDVKIEKVQLEDVTLIKTEELKVEFDLHDTAEQNDDLEFEDNASVFKVENDGVKTEDVIEKYREKDRGFTVEDAFPMDAPKPPGHSKRKNLYRCNTCQHTTYNVNTALIHQRSTHKKTKESENSKYTCELCSTPLKNMKEKTTHYKISHPKVAMPVAKPFICECCGRACKDARVLRQHSLVHSATKPFKCALCPRQFALRKTLSDHVTTHTGVRAFVCEVCGMSFKTKGVLREHMTLHSGRRDFKCKYCPKAYSNSKNLWMHNQSCNDMGTRYKCEHCCKVFALKKVLEFHLKRMNLHKVSADGTLSYWCKMCNKEFASHEETDAHRKFEHQDAMRSEPVPGSDTGHVEEEEVMVLVVGNAGGDPPLASPGVGDVEDARENGYQRKVDRYKCGICPRSYTCYSQLRLHSKSHSDERPYVCDICKKGFKMRAVLERHAMVHTGEKPYKCDMCEKAFTCNRWRQHHVRRIHFNEHIPTKPRIRNKRKNDKQSLNRECGEGEVRRREDEAKTLPSPHPPFALPTRNVFT